MKALQESLRPGRVELGQRRAPHVLAIASGGGHWAQLLRLRPALEGCSVVYVTVDDGYRVDVPADRLYVIPDATRWNKFKLGIVGLRLAWIMVRERPDVVISTGAAPGFIAISLGRLLRARTIWVDSIANAEELSMSGRMACGRVDLCLTQWPHLAKPNGPRYEGTVL